jgi:hypothetical protein
LLKRPNESEGKDNEICEVREQLTELEPSGNQGKEAQETSDFDNEQICSTSVSTPKRPDRSYPRSRAQVRGRRAHVSGYENCTRSTFSATGGATSSRSVSFERLSDLLTDFEHHLVGRRFFLVCFFAAKAETRLVETRFSYESPLRL